MQKEPSLKKINFLTDYDLHLLCESTHYRAWEKMGAHPIEVDGVQGTHFAVWAPNAEGVSVIGDFNGWNPASHPLPCLGDSGIWAGFVPGVEEGAVYKYDIRSRVDGFRAEKADPYAFSSELRPRSASIVCALDGYAWGDAEWMAERGGRNNRHAPISIYEVHLGSWMRAEDGSWLSYRELAPRLVEYLERTGFTHIELLPISEHPFDGSWGYQTVGYFAPTSRFGSPHDFMHFVDTLHQHGIGVILDWVPSHFPKDGHGLAYFDGTHLYEHEDPRKGVHQDWDTLVFNYGRREVDNFLLANALFWLEVFHIDGLRVDAVASMLYLDYSREDGEWIPNKYGGREHLEAVDFLKRFNALVYERHPDVMTIAEESTAWPMVSRPTFVGGLGFGMKWNMGWMHDTLQYLSRDAVHRKHHHNDLTFSLLYAFHENFILALSHDEVVHGKRSLRCKMPGDEWQQFANMRLLYGYMWAHPGKKLLFMGSEFGAYSEWYHETGLEWHLLEQKQPAGLLHWVSDLNRLLRSEPALHDQDCEEPGFEWIDANDGLHSTLSFVRWDRERHDPILCVCNFTPVPREDYRLGVPWGGNWDELLNSDSEIYGGSGIGNAGCVHAEPVPANGREYSVGLKLPPLSVLIFRKSRG